MVLLLSKLRSQESEKMLGLPSTSAKGTEDDRCEGAMLDFNNPLIVLSLLLPFVGFERATDSLTSMCRGVRVKNPNIKKCPFASLPEASDVHSGVVG